MNLPLSMMSKSQLAEKYIGILQPLEAVVSSYNHQHPELHDHDVLHVYEALIKDVRAKLTNFPQPQHNLRVVSNTLYVFLNTFVIEMQNSYSYEEIQQCLKQLEKSVKLWNRELGSRGYLNFISKFN